MNTENVTNEARIATEVFEATEAVLTSHDFKVRLNYEALTEKVERLLGMTGRKVDAYVRTYLVDHPDYQVKCGRNGGVQRREEAVPETVRETVAA